MEDSVPKTGLWELLGVEVAQFDGRGEREDDIEEDELGDVKGDWVELCDKEDVTVPVWLPVKEDE